MMSNESFVTYLGAGIIFLLMAFYNPIRKRFGNKPSMVQFNASQPKENHSISLNPEPPILPPEEDRATIEAKLEARNLDKWCREFEKQELARYFKERFNQYEYSRQMKEGIFLEQRKQRLVEEMMNRRQLEMTATTQQNRPVLQGYFTGFLWSVVPQFSLFFVIMATSLFPTTLYSSEEYVESAGAILFKNISKRQVCILRKIKSSEWLLPKGRRNCGESRHEAALREAREETGYPCRLLPVTIKTRAPIQEAEGDCPDIARQVVSAEEPFCLSVRQMGMRNVKLIWWYIAVVDGDRGEVEEQFEAEFVDYEVAMEKLTFQSDRDIVKMAVNIVGSSYPES